MNFQDFIAGKYGLSHGAITLVLILIGTLLFGVAGNLTACALALFGYYVRELRQGDSMDPRDWSSDGRRDLTAPFIVVTINMIVVALWNA